METLFVGWMSSVELSISFKRAKRGVWRTRKILLCPVQPPSCTLITSVSMKDQSGVDVGSILGRCRVDARSKWARYEVDVKPKRPNGPKRPNRQVLTWVPRAVPTNGIER